MLEAIHSAKSPSELMSKKDDIVDKNLPCMELCEVFARMTDKPKTPTDLPKIGAREMSALREIEHWQSRNSARSFWWRQASMRKLERHGFVKRVTGHTTNPGWAITEKGVFECRK